MPRKGYKQPPEVRAKTGEMSRGRKHTEETKRKISQSHIGMARSPETRAIIGEKSRAWWATMDAQQRRELMTKTHLAVIKKQSPTLIENVTKHILTKAKIKFIENHPVDGFFIDFYLPEHNIALECDGTYWHQLENRREDERIRDEYLTSKGFRIIRISEADIQIDPTTILKKLALKR